MGEKRCFGCMKMISADEEVCPFCGFNEHYYQTEFYHLPLGFILQDRYVVGRVIGEGGFGLTYIGRDNKFNQTVAVKEFYDRDLASRQNTISPALRVYKESEEERYRKELEMIRREALNLKQFSACRGMVRMEDFLEENNTAYLIMEYVEGVSLKQYLKDGGKPDPESCLRIFRPVIESLHLLHKAGILHRNINLDNLVLQDGGDLKLLDFGPSRPAVQTGQTSVTVKYGYAPPEQYGTAEAQGPWSDVYALCVCIYTCVTGKNLKDSKERQDGDPWESTGLPRRQEDALRQGLELDYHKRLQSMARLYQGLYGESLEPGSLPDGGVRDEKASGRKERVSNTGKRRFSLPSKPLLAALAACAAACAILYAAAAGNAAREAGSGKEEPFLADGSGEDKGSEAKEGGGTASNGGREGRTEAAGSAETWTDENGNRYEGTRVNGVIEGKGGCTYADGGRYDGEWREGKRSGTGRYYYSTGDRRWYEGRWENDRKNGEGTLLFTDNSRYEGEWKDDLRAGTGTFFWPDGRRYEGQWQGDEINGSGSLFWDNGDRYEGQWKDGERSGTGTMYFSGGDRYEGQWKDGRMTGAGTYYWADGGRYEGQWLDGRRHGIGTQYDSDGTQYTGEWVNGVRN